VFVPFEESPLLSTDASGLGNCEIFETGSKGVSATGATVSIDGTGVSSATMEVTGVSAGGIVGDGAAGSSTIGAVDVADSLGLSNL
jgi:hypothetical protein